MKNFLLIFCIVNLLFLCACDFNAPLRNKMIDYYSNNYNYSELYGIVKSKQYVDDTQDCIFDILISIDNHSFDSNPETGFTRFILVGCDQACDLATGDEIIFVSAPMYFYNGHHLPIISIEKNGEIILSFDEGKNNYIEWIMSEFN